MGEHKLPKLNTPGDHDIKTFLLGKFTVEMFPEGYILLNRELSTSYHPALEKLLSVIPVDEIDIRLSVISHYCGIVLNGAYTLSERSELCAILAGRLEMLRELGAAQTIVSLDSKVEYDKWLARETNKVTNRERTIIDPSIPGDDQKPE